MPDIEKVIKGLEEAHDIIEKHVPVRYWGYSTFACTDALALLKEREARVMTLEEVMATPKDIAIWQEIKDDPDYKFEISPVAEPSEITIDCNDDWFNLEPKEPIIGIRFASEGYMPKETYGATWRCWTSRPTDEQRKVVKWDD